jgi:hypothetical protein
MVPADAAPIMRPEMTTLSPAVEGFGVEAMVRLDAHALPTQQGAVQHVVVQHDALVQQALAWQQIGCASALTRTPLTGTGQHGTISGAAWAFSGHTIIDRPAAELAKSSALIETTTKSDEYVRIKRPMALTRARKVTTT